jgi:hypothetical protein
MLSVGVLNSARRLRRALWVAAFACWVTAMAAGFHQAMRWEFTPGKSASGAETQNRAGAGPRLVVCLHSQCPCSLATVENLSKLDRESRRKLAIAFVLTGPNVRSAPILKKVSQFSDADIRFAAEGEILARYGARTSGQALLYDSSGRLVFQGGLTDSRGTPGDSAGVRAITDTLAGRKCIASAPVYGCSLQTPR